MNRVRQVFSQARVLLPVIHPVTEAKARASVDLAVRCGVPGIFLINQGMPDRAVLDLAGVFKHEYPHLWIGINLLGWLPTKVLARVAEAGFGGVWADDAGVEESSDDQTYAQGFLKARQSISWGGLYFGGVAFKYKRPVAPGLLGIASKKASALMDVVCTSGEGTGKAAPISKVEAMRQGMGDHALALASGVTAENVAAYLPFVDAYLVGTGIESDLGVLDEKKLRSLYDRIHSFSVQSSSPPPASSASSSSSGSSL